VIFALRIINAVSFSTSEHNTAMYLKIAHLESNLEHTGHARPPDDELITVKIDVIAKFGN